MGIGNEYGASFLSEIADEQGGVCFNYSKCVFDYVRSKCVELL